MSSLQLQQKTTLGLQSQAKILVRVAVLANVLLAVILSALFLIQTNSQVSSFPPSDPRQEKFGVFNPAPVDMLLPSPERWRP